MDGFDTISNGARAAPMAISFACRSILEQDVPNYFAYANGFTLADEMFSSLRASSFPNHLYSIAAQSGGAIGIPSALPDDMGLRCGGRNHSLRDRLRWELYLSVSMFRFSDAGRSAQNAGISSWTMYSPNRSAFNSYDAINHIRNSSYLDHQHSDRNPVRHRRCGRQFALGELGDCGREPGRAPAEPVVSRRELDRQSN